MKLCLFIALLLVPGLHAQAPAATEQPSSFEDFPPDTWIATVDGKKVTAAQLQTVLRAVPAQAQQQAMQHAEQFLRQYGLLRRLTELAEKNQLDQRSPAKELLEYNRMVALAQAQLTEVQDEITVSPEDLQKYYDANQDRYTQAKVKVIYVPFSPNATAGASEKKVLSEAEAKAKAEKLLAEIRQGADFVQLVKKHSGDPVSAAKDGDFGTIKRSDKIPDAVKETVFALKPGEVSEPVRQPNGYYLFRVEESGTQAFDEVEEQILNEMKQTKFSEWVLATQQSVQIKIENEAFFSAGKQPTAAPAVPAPAVPAPASPSPVK